MTDSENDHVPLTAEQPNYPNTLRTRIAAAMTAEVERNGLDSPVDDWIPFLADAVIRELKLTVLGDGIVVGVIHV